MCDKCKKLKNVKHWVHIADKWTDREKQEIIEYLITGNLSQQTFI